MQGARGHVNSEVDLESLRTIDSRQIRFDVFTTLPGTASPSFSTKIHSSIDDLSGEMPLFSSSSAIMHDARASSLCAERATDRNLRKRCFVAWRRSAQKAAAAQPPTFVAWEVQFHPLPLYRLRPNHVGEECTYWPSLHPRRWL